jgi:hypothetical protein
VIDMAAGAESFSEVDEMDGDAVFDIGGVSGVVYGTGVDCSIVCIMIAVREEPNEEKASGSIVTTRVFEVDVQAQRAGSGL